MHYLAHDLSLEAQWRAIVLFGKNTASYKFALGKTLLEFAAEGRADVPIEELAFPFALHIADHLRREDRQTTLSRSRFLDACRAYNAGDLDADDLRADAVRDGFRYVLDAFHNVNRAPVPVPFFHDERASEGRIVLTDDLHRLASAPAGRDLPLELEARWRLVETAWGLGLSHHVLDVHFDPGADELFVVPVEDRGRVSVTSSRDALNGYQKGACFYCFRPVSVVVGADDLAEVDHVWPHVLRRDLPDVHLDGVWNLVLACRDCNRGPGGKFTQAPSARYLERLHTRNEFLIASHHPLRETLIRQTGKTPAARRAYLKGVDRRAHARLIHRWSATEEAPPAF